MRKVRRGSHLDHCGRVERDLLGDRVEIALRAHELPRVDQLCGQPRLELGAALVRLDALHQQLDLLALPAIQRREQLYSSEFSTVT